MTRDDAGALRHLLETLPAMEPDTLRSDRVRRSCRATLVRQPAQPPAVTDGRSMRAVFGRALVYGWCAAYLLSMMLVLLQVYGHR